jgi:hypothetical protein
VDGLYVDSLLNIIHVEKFIHVEDFSRNVVFCYHAIKVVFFDVFQLYVENRLLTFKDHVVRGEANFHFVTFRVHSLLRENSPQDWPSHHVSVPFSRIWCFIVPLILLKLIPIDIVVVNFPHYADFGSFLAQKAFKGLRTDL